MKPISKSKRQLAQLLVEAGVTQFPEGANWAAQDKVWERYAKRVMFYSGPHKPEVYKGDTAWRPFRGGGFLLNHVEPVALTSLIPNWHQTVLSRDEFDQIVAETAPDADGWILWNGGECPVAGLSIVDVKYFDVEGFTTGIALDFVWGPKTDIVYYRNTRGESEPPYNLPEVSNFRCVTAPTTAPTLDQLLQDWRNAYDFATRKQAEADEAAAMRDERWKAVQARAGEMGVTVGRCEKVVVADDDGWIIWGGGKCPVDDEQLVRVKVRGEIGTARGKAGHWSWGHSGCGSDIIAYRLARP